MPDRSSIFSLTLCLMLFPTVAQAQQVPPQVTPGALSNEQQRQQKKLENQAPAPQTAPQTAPVVGPPSLDSSKVLQTPGAAFRLTDVTFDDSRLLSKEELARIARDYVGRTVRFKDLSGLVEKINALYRSKGQVTARAILPPQKIENGVLHIALVEGRLGSLVIKNAVRANESFVRDRLNLPQGETIDVTQLTRQIVYFNRTNDVQLRAMLKPGAGFGQTDIELSLAEPKSDFLQVFVDNYGVESTGRLEGGIYYRHTDLAGIDDRLTFYVTGSGGGIDGNLSYTVPVSRTGDRLSFGYERNHIDIVDGQFQSLGIHGNGQTGTIGLNHPLLATTSWLASASLSQAIGTSSTRVPTGPITDTETYRTTLGGSATYIGESLMATVSHNFVYARSHDDLLTQDREALLFNGAASALWRLPASFSLRLSTVWQFACQKQLPADLLFQIGGVTSVRGYANGTFAGDSGFYSNLELHKTYTKSAFAVDVYAAYDAGMAFSTTPSERSLQSAAFGAELDYRRFSLNAGVGIPLSKPSPDADATILYLQLTAHL